MFFPDRIETDAELDPRREALRREWVVTEFMRADPTMSREEAERRYDDREDVLRC